MKNENAPKDRNLILINSGQRYVIRVYLHKKTTFKGSAKY
jgi:hypothetical protein